LQCRCRPYHRSSVPSPRGALGRIVPKAACTSDPSVELRDAHSVALLLAQHCIQGRADRPNLASAPLIPTRSPDPAPTTTKSSRLDGFCHPPHHRQIAVARGAFPTSTPRGFLPWGLSDDGPRACPHCRDGPSSETLHNSGRQPRTDGPGRGHILNAGYRVSATESLPEGQSVNGDGISGAVIRAPSDYGKEMASVTPGNSGSHRWPWWEMVMHARAPIPLSAARSRNRSAVSLNLSNQTAAGSTRGCSRSHGPDESDPAREG